MQIIVLFNTKHHWLAYKKGFNTKQSHSPYQRKLPRACTYWYLLQYPKVFFFFFITMSLLSDLINLNLSESTEKIIAEYIWWALSQRFKQLSHKPCAEYRGLCFVFCLWNLWPNSYCSINVIKPLYGYTMLSDSGYILFWVILLELCFLWHVLPSNT